VAWANSVINGRACQTAPSESARITAAVDPPAEQLVELRDEHWVGFALFELLLKTKEIIGFVWSFFFSRAGGFPA
jgi:hypothetical protein